MSLDELFEILDCYSDEVYDWMHYKRTNDLLWTTDNTNKIQYYDNGTTTAIKNYADSGSVQLNGHN